ncbi:MAG: YggS family pyridoxal phosphate-dependent enzyme [Gammaproteobacteria bacterium]|nr:YggS family pyridoxal phosphate-dependent enzyme [Gammaproteobacteria bacterium]
MNTIAENIQQIIEQIHEFEQSYNRPEGSVTLLAVSKKQPIDKILQAHKAGIRDFGENYLQEAEEKISQLVDLDINWHFIGPIQSNKTRAIADLFQWVHSVDRLKIARRLSDQRNSLLPPLNVCIQVNLSGEETKSGISIDEVENLCNEVAKLPNLHLRGLMTIPAPTEDFTGQRQLFSALAVTFNNLVPRFPGFDTLSMGMSGDFKAAIAEGSTVVRIGTALFGPRM